MNLSIDDYLAKVAGGVDDDYGQMLRSNFRDNRGWSELGMLASPSGEELEQLRRGVAIMTSKEKENATDLSDEQIQTIASDAKIDAGLFAIFINGYILESKRVSQSQ